MTAKRLLGIVFWVSVLGTASSLQAFNPDQQHQQNYSDGDKQVHARGTTDSTQSFGEQYQHPITISSYGNRLDRLFSYTSWTTFIFFVIMASALGYFLFAYRYKEGRRAYYTHGTSKANNMVTRALDVAVFLSLDLVLIIASYMDTKDIVWNYPSGEDVVKVMVMPQQWVWNFKQAGADGKFGTPDDINTINDLRVPKDRKVMLQIKSKDVIHGFFIPNVRMQVDALPGVVTKLWFDADRTGDFEIACYHHCGTSHYKMKAFLKVMEDGDYNAWVDEMSEWAITTYDPDDKLVNWGWKWTPETSNQSSQITRLDTSKRD